MCDCVQFVKFGRCAQAVCLGGMCHERFDSLQIGDGFQTFISGCVEASSCCKWL